MEGNTKSCTLLRPEAAKQECESPLTSCQIVDGSGAEHLLPLLQDAETAAGDINENSLMNKTEGLHRGIKELNRTVAKQRHLISRLKSQLNAEMAFLDLVEEDRPRVTLRTELNQIRASIRVDCQPNIESSRETASVTTATVAPSAVADESLVFAAKKQVLAAVHTKLQLQQQRKMNVIVKGLKPVDGVDDAKLFAQLCER
jgi:hypothetical protein